MAEQTPRYWDAVEPIWDVINIYEGADIFLASFAKVPRPVGIVYAAHFCLSEVHNGGFLQFFKNSTGVLAPEALEGFRAIAMPQLASVVNEAMNVLGPEYPRDRDARCEAILSASPLSGEEIEKAFKEAKKLYLAYAKVAAPLPWDSLSEQVWQLAATENGDFGNAATKYLLDLGLLSRQ
jgi:hypothetical protein